MGANWYCGLMKPISGGKPNTQLGVGIDQLPINIRYGILTGKQPGARQC
jgi:hypothetical protein